MHLLFPLTMRSTACLIRQRQQRAMWIPSSPYVLVQHMQNQQDRHRCRQICGVGPHMAYTKHSERNFPQTVCVLARLTGIEYDSTARCALTGCFTRLMQWQEVCYIQDTAQACAVLCSTATCICATPHELNRLARKHHVATAPHEPRRPLLL